jgi:hypothetical protein
VTKARRSVLEAIFLVSFSHTEHAMYTKKMASASDGVKFHTKSKYFRDLLVTCVTYAGFGELNLNWHFIQTLAYLQSQRISICGRCRVPSADHAPQLNTRKPTLTIFILSPCMLLHSVSITNLMHLLIKSYHHSHLKLHTLKMSVMHN